MTAPGVMTNGTPAGALLNNLSFQGMSDKLNAKGSFEKIMESAQVTKAQGAKVQDGKPQGAKPQAANPQGAKAQAAMPQGANPQEQEANGIVSETDNGQAEDVKDQVKSMFSGNPKVTGKEAAGQAKLPADDGLDEPVDEAMMEAVATLVVQIRTLVCEALDCSDEELSQTMEALDRTDADLFDRNGLQELFLVGNAAEDSTEFLTNEALFDDFAGMMQAVEQAVRESDLTPETVLQVLRSETEALPEQEVLDAEPVSEDIVPTVVPDMVQEAAPSLAERDVPKEAKAEADADTDTKAQVNTAVAIDTDADTEAQVNTAVAIDTDADTEDGTEEDVVAVSQTEEEKAPDAKTTKTEVKAEAKNAEGKQHVVAAKGTAEKKEASTETDGSFKSSFIDAMTAKLHPTFGSEEALAATRQLREIANQVLDQIKVIIRPEQTNMELQLNPEHLGRVHLTVTEKEGMMTAQFTTQTQVAKEAIESQMEILKESLFNQGIKVEAIEVTVSEFGFARDRDANRNSGEEQGRRRRNNGLRDTAVEEDAPRMEDYINATDSSVDYSA